MNTIGKRKLSEEEIAALLKEREGQDEARTAPENCNKRISQYDFTQPCRFSKSELDSLRKINESLAQSAAANISRLVDSVIKVRLRDMDQMKWGDFTGAGGDPGVGFIFRMEPDGYSCAFIMERNLAFCCVERLTGGSAAGDPEGEEDGSDGAELTFLEQKLVIEAGGCFVHQLPEVWSKAGPFEINAGAFVEDFTEYDLMPANEDVFTVSFSLQGAVGNGEITIVTPFKAVQGLPPSSQQTDRKVALSDEDVFRSIRASLDKTTLELVAVLGAADMKVNYLLNLEAGDVLLLDKKVDQKVELLCNNNPKLKGYVGVSSSKYAVRIDDDREA